MTTAFPNFIYANPWVEDSNPAIAGVAIGATDAVTAVAKDDGGDGDDGDSDK